MSRYGLGCAHAEREELCSRLKHIRRYYGDYTQLCLHKKYKLKEER